MFIYKPEKLFLMPRKRSIIAAAPMVDIFKQAGAQRVSDSAARALSEILMERGLEVAKDSLKYAMHAGRKTIKREDVLLARKGA